MTNLKNLTKPVRALYISTYIPRKCGIATFTKDLTNAINLLNPLALAQIAAMDNGISEGLRYPHEVKFRIRQEVKEDYDEVVKHVNETGEVDIVVIQHEFGIFGGESGDLILDMIERLQKPLILTLHTVLEKPTPKMKEIIKRLGKKAEYMVVMLEAAGEMLINKYEVDRRKVMVIPHGVPDFPRLTDGKKKLGLQGKVVMTSANLVSWSKGIEYVIAAMPEILKEIPELVYFVVGETHPVVKQTEGEKYRVKLKKMAKDLNLGRHVRFVNEYLPLQKLIKYVGASDLYITPYLDPQQAASGSLAYAIGAGKACISTPYLYAREMFKLGCGKLVPFADSAAIAKAVVETWTDKQSRIECEEKAYELGRTMTWYFVGHQYYHLMQHALKKN
ncbi:MAG: glycosyl transferase group 1 [Microgenomates group bacterium Gr01-1014_16]|nr:MAG: glycosyl transferase group 1 [Microgenomates group bacterium Gr01-1014_16]